MILDSTIQNVKAVNIVDVVSRYIDLSKKGATWTASCPFHDEKSASFTIKESAQFFKCFGCGEGGDSIAFVMKHLRLDFEGAIIEIAKNHSIKVEKKEGKATPTKKINPTLYTVNKNVADIYNIYTEVQEASNYLHSRGYGTDEITQWNLGYAPVGNKIHSFAQDNSFIVECDKLGLISSKDSKPYYDFFRERIIFPIINERGEVVGFGGRKLNMENKFPKYINSKESEVFDKSKVIYGLYQSLKSIKEKGHAILVEGYTDVISLHKVGIDNAVATCGTALTPFHTQLLKRYTQKVIIMRDGDKAGFKATLRDIDLLLTAGIEVSVYSLMDGQDPDDFAKYYDKHDLQDKTVDGVIFIAAQNFTEDIKGKPRKVTEAVKTISDSLLFIDDELLRETYIKEICRKFSEFDIEADNFKKIISKTNSDILKKEKAKSNAKFNLMDSEKGSMSDRVPDDSIDDYYRHRYFQRSTGIETGLWFPQQEGSEFVRLTNFILNPLFHLKSPEKNVRLVEAIGFDHVSHRNFTNIIELQSAEMLTKSQFAQKLFDIGPYLLESSFTNLHLSKINSKIAFEFRIANEITSLGWQEEGFWAFANKAYKDGLRDYDRFGIVNVGEANFLSPSASEMHKDEKESVYENDKMHSFYQSNETFKTWSTQIMRVYGDNGYTLICYAVMTIFVDIVKKYTEAPLWYPYGPKESGKSTLAKSLFTLFFHYTFDPFNLGTASTDYAFFNRLERFNNCPAAFNEFDEFAIKDEWFRAFKAAYDGEGRERGRGIKGKTHTQKVRAAVVIIGQYLSTKDDNSVLSRTIPCLVKPKVFTQMETDTYEVLKKMERQGLTSILLEILQYRDAFSKEFKSVFDKKFSSMREHLQTRKIAFSGRILKNYATIVAAASTLMGRLQFPFSEEELTRYALRRVEEISSTMSESNALADFWKTIEHLVDRNQIIDGWDFRIKMEKSVKVLKDRNTKEDVHFQEVHKVIYIRIPSVFREYAKVVGQITKGKGLNEQTLLTYLKEQQYFIGNNPGLNFSKTEMDGTFANKVTSSMALYYDQIGVTLEKSFEEEDNRTDEEFKAIVKTNPSETTSSTQVEFRVEHSVTRTLIDSPIPKTEILFTRCFAVNDEVVKTYIQEGRMIRLTGKVAYNNVRGRVYRNMDVESYQMLESFTHEPVTPPPESNQDNDTTKDLF